MEISKLLKDKDLVTLNKFIEYTNELNTLPVLITDGDNTLWHDKERDDQKKIILPSITKKALTKYSNLSLITVRHADALTREFHQQDLLHITPLGNYVGLCNGGQIAKAQTSDNGIYYSIEKSFPMPLQQKEELLLIVKNLVKHNEEKIRIYMYEASGTKEFVWLSANQKDDEQKFRDLHTNASEFIIGDLEALEKLLLKQDLAMISYVFIDKENNKRRADINAPRVNKHFVAMQILELSHWRFHPLIAAGDNRDQDAVNGHLNISTLAVYVKEGEMPVNGQIGNILVPDYESFGHVLNYIADQIQM